MRAIAALAPSTDVSVIPSQNVFVPLSHASLADLQSALERCRIAARIEGVVTVADEPPHWWINVAPHQPLLLLDTIFA